MKKILVIGSGSDIAVELVKKIHHEEDAYFTLISSDNLTNKKYSFLNGNFFFKKINYEKNIKIFFLSVFKKNIFNEIFILNGYLPKNSADAEQTKSLAINFTQSVKLLSLITDFYKNNKLKVVVFSSPAADRPRKINFIYGSHKKALEFHLSGLRLLFSRIHFVIVKPGPTQTKMTNTLKGFKHKPQTVAKSIYWQLKLGFDTIYSPFFWRLIMFFISMIPKKIFKHLNF
jgi:hypothetical protein